MIQKRVCIENELGLHARAAAKLVKLTTQFEADVKLSRLGSNDQIDGKSILGLLLLAASRGTILQLTFLGRDEAQAAEAVERLIKNKFGEAK